MITRLFSRYDLDMSGTINSNEELGQLTLNVIVQLELDVSPEQIEKDTSEEVYGVLNDDNALTLEEFRTWFWNIMVQRKKPSK